ncbi:MAG: pseudouridine synthase family protein [Desulfovibrionaceae bacterium]
MYHATRCVRIDASLDGARLDKALAACLPGVGLRARRRAWETHEVLVDGHPRPKGYTVRAGQLVCLRPREGGPPDAQSLLGLVRVVAENPDWAALAKPGGLHTEALAGRPGESVDMVLDRFWPGRGAVLLNRLDCLTSGLVLAGFGPLARERFRALEDAAAVEKRYLALVHGHVAAPFVCGNALDTADRARARVLPAQAPALRHTVVTPLARPAEADATLVRAVILKGARHQIRAHLAHAGHPICGDPVYGPADEATAWPVMHLHHARVSFADFTACCVPDWPHCADAVARAVAAEGMDSR